MSESTATAALPEFTDEELAQLRKDDLFAGKFIGRTLVLIFLYSLMIVGGVAWWTHGIVSERAEAASSPSTTTDEL